MTEPLGVVNVEPVPPAPIVIVMALPGVKPLTLVSVTPPPPPPPATQTPPPPPPPTTKTSAVVTPAGTLH